MKSKGIDIPGADQDLMDILNELVRSWLFVLAVFENETLQLKGEPLIPLAEVVIQDEIDSIVKLPKLAAAYDRSFLDNRVWSYYSFVREIYKSVDDMIDELNQLLSESPETDSLLTMPLVELQNVSIKIGSAKVAYETVHSQLSKYRSDKWRKEV